MPKDEDDIISQMVVLLLETEPDPEKGYFGLAIRAAEEAYRIKTNKIISIPKIRPRIDPDEILPKEEPDE